MKRSILLLIFLLTAVSAYGKEFAQAYEDKLIQDLKGIYTLEAVKTPDNPTGHPVDATPIILQAKHDLLLLSPAAREAVYPFLTRPDSNLGSSADSPGGHFRIHFTKFGTDAIYQPTVDNNGNGVPDYVDSCALILEYIWQKEIDTLGYFPPPSDSFYSLYGWDNGGDGKYDVYLRAFGGGILGQTTPETTQTPGSVVYTSFIELDNDYLGYPNYHSQYDWFRVTAAHEFFHAIQFGYDASELEVVSEEVVHPYWMEMSAVWMEEQVYDYINDYINYLQGLSSIFNKPWLSLRNFDGLHPYSACIWPIFLGERFNDINIVKNIWSVCAQVPGDNVLSAPDQILKDLYSSSLNDAFREFSVWNYFTGDRANPSVFGFYSEGDLFWTKDNPPKPIKVYETHIHEVYPVTDSVRQLPEDLGTTYITFKPIVDSLGGLTIYFKGKAGGARWNASLIDFRSNDHPFEDTTIDLSPDSGVGWVFDWGRFSEISMVIARGDTISSPNFDYSYTANFDTSLFHGFIPPSADKIYQNFPNPFVIIDASSTTKFPMLLKNLTDVELFIFTTSGELVWKHLWQNKIGDYTTVVFADPEFIPFKWNGRNMNGEYVASGIYLYRIVTNGTSTTKKLVVVNER